MPSELQDYNVQRKNKHVSKDPSSTCFIHLHRSENASKCLPTMLVGQCFSWFVDKIHRNCHTGRIWSWIYDKSLTQAVFYRQSFLAYFCVHVSQCNLRAASQNHTVYRGLKVRGVFQINWRPIKYQHLSSVVTLFWNQVKKATLEFVLTWQCVVVIAHFGRCWFHHCQVSLCQSCLFWVR